MLARRDLAELRARALKAPWLEQNQLIDAAAAELSKLRAQADNNQGFRWAEQGVNLDEAKRLIEAALLVEPSSPTYLDSLGWVYYKLGQFEQAAESLTKAVPESPPREAGGDQPKSEIPEILDHLGDALWRVGRSDEARDAWRRAAKQSKRSHEVAAAANAKLAAVERGESPKVALTAAEQAPATRPATQPASRPAPPSTRAAQLP